MLCGVLRENNGLERRFVARRNSIRVFKDTIRLHLDAAVFPVAQLGGHFHATICQDLREGLRRRRHGKLHAGVQQHDGLGALVSGRLGILRHIRAVVMTAATTCHQHGR